MLLCSYSDSSKAFWFAKYAHDRKCRLLKRMMQLVQKHSKYIGNQDSFLGKNFGHIRIYIQAHGCTQQSLYNNKKAE